MKYVIETSAGFLSHGTEKPSFANAQVFANRTAAAAAARSGTSDTLVPFDEARAKAKANQAPKSAVSGF